MLQLPARFSASVSSQSGTTGEWPIEAGPFRSTCAIPSAFGGTGGAFSPEDLFALALANCFVATLKVYAAASRVSFRDVTTNASLTVDRDSLGQPMMSHCLLEIRISGAERPDRIETLVHKALRSGFILNSVKTQIESRVIIESDSELEAERSS